MPTISDRSRAVRFLQRASFGATLNDVDQLVGIGENAWIDQQLATPAQGTHLGRRIAHGGTIPSVWETYLSAPDQLRKRYAYALSQIFVASGRVVGNERMAAYIDLLEANCFGTYRELIEAITRSQAMGQYLTYEFNQRADSNRGTVPDENYAREIMQLFSIGLWELNADGTRRVDGSGAPIPTYDNDDIQGLARVFTGFSMPYGDLAAFANPMNSDDGFAQEWHERGEKRFLGQTIPASPSRTLNESVALALDIISAHPNVGPFLATQLIQRLVTSNPAPSYVARIAAVFDNDGTGTRGNLAAVVRAILTDPDATSTSPDTDDGKIREPVLRFTTVTRALGISCTGVPWPIFSLADASEALGQQPFEANSVFNFFRPGYVPPKTAIADFGLVAPELQIANETTNIGWVNFLQQFLLRPPQAGATQIQFDIDDLIALAPGATISAQEAGQLVDEVAARLCPFGLNDSTRNRIVDALVGATNPNGLDALRLDRVMGTAAMVAASTEFIYER